MRRWTRTPSPAPALAATESAPTTSPPTPKSKSKSILVGTGALQTLAAQAKLIHASSASPDNSQTPPKLISPSKRFIHRRSFSQSEDKRTNTKNMLDLQNAAAQVRRKSFRSHRLSILENSSENKSDMPQGEFTDILNQALNELLVLAQERKQDEDLFSRLDGISNLLKVAILEASLNRAEEIERAMVAEVLDYENNDIVPQAYMFANWISRHFISLNKVNNQKGSRLKKLRLVQSSPSPEEVRTPTSLQKRNSDDLLLTRFDPKQLDDPSALESDRIRISTVYETNFGSIRMLLRLNTWDNFDVFSFGHQSNGSPLRNMLLYLYNLLNFESLGVEQATFCNFAEAVENGYNDVPYHNKYHAADVVQAVHFFFENTRIQSFVGNLDYFAAIISAAVHDLGHRGRSNNFEIDAESGLAIRYNDISVLENHHIAVAFRMMLVPELNILANFKRSTRKELRELMIKMVLGTDLKGHFTSLASLKAMVEVHQKANSWFDPENAKEREMLLVQCVHCADISSPCKPARIAVEWTNRLEQEWFEEGDEQKALGLQIGPMMDRDNPCTEQSQVGFLKFIVQPLMKTFSDAVGKEAFKPIFYNLELNMKYWQMKVLSNNIGASPQERLAEVAPEVRRRDSTKEPKSKRLSRFSGFRRGSPDSKE